MDSDYNTIMSCIYKNNCICNYELLNCCNFITTYLRQISNQDFEAVLQSTSIIFYIISKQGVTCKSILDIKSSFITSKVFEILLKLALNHPYQSLRFLSKKCIVEILQQDQQINLDTFNTVLTKAIKDEPLYCMELMNSYLTHILKKSHHPIFPEQCNCQNSVDLNYIANRSFYLKHLFKILKDDWTSFCNIEGELIKIEWLTIWLKCLKIYAQNEIISIEKIMYPESLSYIIASTLNTSNTVSKLAFDILIEALKNKSFPWISELATNILKEESLHLCCKKSSRKAILVHLKALAFVSEQKNSSSSHSSLIKYKQLNIPQTLVDVFFDEDDLLFEMMKHYLEIYQNLGPKTAQDFNFNPHKQFIYFLKETGFDHQILMDFLLSEIESLVYLVTYLKQVLKEWSLFQQAHEYLDISLESTMSTLIRLQVKLTKSNEKELIPYNINPLLNLLELCDEQYDKFMNYS